MFSKSSVHGTQYYIVAHCTSVVYFDALSCHVIRTQHTHTHTDRKLEQRRRRVACVIRIHGNSILLMSSDVHEFLNRKNKSPISLCDDIFNLNVSIGLMTGRHQFTGQYQLDENGNVIVHASLINLKRRYLHCGRR